MKKTDEIFAKTIENVLTESSLENLKIQSVVDRSFRHGYNKGWGKGYFSGLFMTGGLLAVAWVWRSVGRLEGFEKGSKEAAKEAGFWRRLYSFNAERRFGENCESYDKKSDSDEDDEDKEDEC